MKTLLRVSAGCDIAACEIIPVARRAERVAKLKGQNSLYMPVAIQNVAFPRMPEVGICRAAASRTGVFQNVMTGEVVFRRRGFVFCIQIVAHENHFRSGLPYGLGGGKWRCRLAFDRFCSMDIQKGFCPLSVRAEPVAVSCDQFQAGVGTPEHRIRQGDSRFKRDGRQVSLRGNDLPVDPIIAVDWRCDPSFVVVRVNILCAAACLRFETHFTESAMAPGFIERGAEAYWREWQ